MYKTDKSMAAEKCQQCVLFARVSTSDQFDKGASIPAQVEKLREYCERRNLKIIAEFEISESSTIGNRKEFKKMIEFVKAQKHKTAIVCHCVDRLQRGYSEYVILDTLRASGQIELHFYKEGLILTKDSNSADISRWDFGILGAKMYVGNLRDNVKRSQAYKVQQGQWLSFAPIGYLNTRDEKGQADIIVDPVRSPMVKTLFEMYATGHESLKTLETYAQKIGLKSASRLSTRTISRVQINDMLRNSFYIGTMAIRKRVKTSETLYLPHRYPTFITRELFDRVQSILNDRQKNKETSKAWQGEDDFVLRGLIRCAHCGGLMTPEQHYKKGNNKVYRYIKCNHSRDKNCPQKLIPESKVLKQFEEKVFNQIHLGPKTIETIRKAVKEGMKEDVLTRASNKRTITMQINALEEKRQKLLSAWLDGEVQEIDYNKMNSEIAKEIEEKREIVDKLGDQSTQLDNKLEQLSEFAIQAKDMFTSSINSKKHKILKLLLSNLEISGENVMFSIRKPFDKLLFSKGCKTWYLWPDLNQHDIAINRF